MKSAIISKQTQRRLSPWRVLFAIFISLSVVYGVFQILDRWQDTIANRTFQPWFASYVDITATPQYAFEQLGSNPTQNNLILSFIVSSPSKACTPTWGGIYSMDDARAELDLDRRIARLRQQGGNIAVSFGGLLNDELAINCDNNKQLQEAYQSVVDRYKIDTIDLDLEGNGLTNIEALNRRALVMANLQQKQKSKEKNLAVWLTLPVSPQGLTQDGTNAIAQMLSNGVDLTGVNVMTMDYNKSREENQTMQDASERALIETHRQLGIIYKQAGINYSGSTLWSKIGATPMIGQNDVVKEIFTLKDAQGFNTFAISKGITRLSMWSANRDIECGENYVTLNVVSDSCSGVKQDKLSYASTLGKGFDGNISGNTSFTTTQTYEVKQKKDNPEESPYQIWTDTTTYLKNTKVVWRQNVYEAKWWTKGDIPDNPTLQSWETPWQLVGPVLPGEKPIPQATLPKGTYPTWSGAYVYDDGQRVLFEGIPYEAKWWTKGDSPAASSSDFDNSPWVPLTREEIDEVIKTEIGK